MPWLHPSVSMPYRHVWLCSVPSSGVGVTLWVGIGVSSHRHLTILCPFYLLSILVYYEILTFATLQVSCSSLPVFPSHSPQIPSDLSHFSFAFLSLCLLLSILLSSWPSLLFLLLPNHQGHFGLSIERGSPSPSAFSTICLSLLPTTISIKYSLNVSLSPCLNSWILEKSTCLCK